jgi:hypothetical protein
MFDPRLPWWRDGPTPDAWPPPTVEDEDRAMNPKSGARFLIGLLVLVLVLYAVWLLLSMLPLPAPLGIVILIILFLIALGTLLQWCGWWSGP